MEELFMFFVYVVAFALKSGEEFSNHPPRRLLKIGRSKTLVTRLNVLLNDIKNFYGEPYQLDCRNSFVINVPEDKMSDVETKLKNESIESFEEVYGIEFRKYSARNIILKIAEQVISTNPEYQLIKGNQFKALYEIKEPIIQLHKISSDESMVINNHENSKELLALLPKLLGSSMVISNSQSTITILVNCESTDTMRKLEGFSIFELEINGELCREMMFCICWKSKLTEGAKAVWRFNLDVSRSLKKIPYSNNPVVHDTYNKVADMLAVHAVQRQLMLLQSK